MFSVCQIFVQDKYLTSTSSSANVGQSLLEMPPQYPIRAAAKLTGLPVDTLRAWERRYNAVTPIRDGRGRLYGAPEIHRLLLLRRAVESGHAIGQVAGLSDADLEALQATGQPPQPGQGLDALQPLLKAIERCDYLAANDELGRLAVLLPTTDLVHRIILPVMRIAGERWHDGNFHIAQEHLVSSCVRNLLGGLVRRNEADRNAPCLLFTTPAGELHEFGILAAALLASARRFRVAYLGPNLPAGDIAFAVRKMAPRALVLGVMETNSTPALRADLSLLAGDLPVATELWIGGSGRTSVSSAVRRPGTVILDDLVSFEQNLNRLEPTS